MRTRMRLAVSSALVTGLAGAVISVAATSAHAAAFGLQEQSTRAIGRAFSGEVADTGPESLWWNPASIAGSPAEAYGSVTGIFPNSSVTDTGSTLTLPVPPAGLTVPVGGRSKADNPILEGVVPAGGFSTPIGDRFAAGLSIAAPYDFVTKYGASSFARYEGLKTRLNTADIQLTGAMKAAPWLDLGAGLDVVYTSANLENASPNLAPGAPDGFSGVHGDGWNLGWNVGAQFHPADAKWRVGLSYRSAVVHELSGDVLVSGLGGPLAAANMSTHGTAKFTTPWIATIGARYPLTDKLTLNAQVQRSGWSEFKDITINLAGGAEVIPQNYKDTTSVAFGGDYALTPAVTLRAGAQFDPTPTPDVGRTVRVPDSNRWLINAGGELHLNSHLTLEGAVEYVDFRGSRVNSQTAFYQGTAAESVADYSADASANAVVVSGGARWRF